MTVWPRAIAVTWVEVKPPSSAEGIGRGNIRPAVVSHGMAFITLRHLATILVLTGAVFFTGCAHMTTTRTGFLGDYGQLKSDPKDTRRLAFEKSDWKKADYASVWLEPTTVRLGPADEKKITAQERTELAAYCDAALKKAFEKDLKLVTKAEDGTLRLRAAVTGVDTSSPALNVVTGVLLWPLDNGGVSLEFEVLDATQGERLAALVGYSEGTPLQVIGSFSRFGHAHSGIDHWAAELHKLVRPVAEKVAPK